eukprot:260839-Alexandrium_andersonii.AAC.1
MQPDPAHAPAGSWPGSSRQRLSGPGHSPQAAAACLPRPTSGQCAARACQRCAPSASARWSPRPRPRPP